ncbi:MAG: acyltransferase, partial [Lachnospiraceae bacterium]|nr:acyltransferase [Lachnospiraceae bacterium]
MDKDSVTKKRGKIYGIDIVRILACISVYTHHYLRMELEPAMEGFNTFRRSSLFKCLFGILGAEYAVIAFFVIAGFFMSYNTGKEPIQSIEYGKKCMYKCMKIIIPSFTVITATALISLPLKIAGMAEIFSIREYFFDLLKLIIGIQGDKHIHYAYPLWFQHFIFMGYIFGYIFLYVFRNEQRIRLAAYIPVLIYSLFNSEYVFMVFVGMLVGELCTGKYEKRLRKIFGNVFLNVLFMIILSSGMSFVIKENYDIPGIYGPATLLFALFLLIVYCMSDSAEGNKHKAIDFLSSN